VSGSTYEMEIGSEITVGKTQCRVIRPLGRGGQATVYDVQDLTTKRHYALKVPNADATDFDQVAEYREAVVCLNREARVSKGKGLVPSKFHQVRDAEGREVAGLSMPIAACSIAQEARRPSKSGKGVRQFSDDQIASVAQQAAGALQSLHEEHYVHRDVKPENLLMFNYGTTNEKVMLTDFGSTRVDGSKASVYGTTVGFERPEQRAEGYHHAFQKPVSPKDDVYALGATMFELRTKSPPEVNHGKAIVALPFGKLRSVVETACHGQDLNDVRVQLCGFPSGAAVVEPNRRFELMHHYLQSEQQQNPQLDLAIARNMKEEGFSDNLGSEDKDLYLRRLQSREAAALDRIRIFEGPEVAKSYGMTR